MARDPFPVDDALRMLFKRRTLTIDSAEQARDARRLVVDSVRQGLSAIDGSVLTPILIDAMTRYYWTKHGSLWLGNGLKLALASSWSCRGEQRGISAVIELLGSLALFERLDLAALAFELAGSGSWEISADGVFSSGAVDDVLTDIAHAFAGRGGLGRLAHSLWPAQDDLRWIVGVHDVLAGANPANVAALDGTFLSGVPGTVRGFWEGLACLASIAAAIDRAGASPDPLSVVLLSASEVRDAIAAPASAIARLQHFCWDPAFVASRESDVLILERPLVPVTSGRNDEFATSFPIVFDAVNWFLDASVFNFPGFGWSQLPQQYGQREIDARFEDWMRSTFSDLGFVVGRVDMNGTWRPFRSDERPRRLSHVNNVPCPGEIDVVAIKADAGVGFVIDCKVLRSHASRSAIRNTFKRLGPEDVDSFSNSTMKKCEWIGGVNDDTMRSAQIIFPLVVVDQPTIGQTLSPIVVDAAGAIARARGYANHD